MPLQERADPDRIREFGFPSRWDEAVSTEVYREMVMGDDRLAPKSLYVPEGASTHMVRGIRVVLEEYGVIYPAFKRGVLAEVDKMLQLLEETGNVNRFYWARVSMPGACPTNADLTSDLQVDLYDVNDKLAVSYAIGTPDWL